MKLVFSSVEGLSLAHDYGRRRWAVDASTDRPELTHAAPQVKAIVDGDLAVEVFDGVVTGLDDADEDKFVAVTNSEEVVREFDMAGESQHYPIGKRIALRYVVTSHTPRGREVIVVLEIWIE